MDDSEDGISSSLITDSNKSQFNCHICLSEATEPVVTLCGHLFCWPCLYRWICIRGQKTCPACKDYCDEDRLIPVYCPEAADSSNPLADKSIPPRPSALRLLMPSGYSQRVESYPLQRRWSWSLPGVTWWHRGFSLTHQAVLKQLLFVTGSLLILVLLIW